jgi:hypothetical protein
VAFFNVPNKFCAAVSLHSFYCLVSNLWLLLLGFGFLWKKSCCGHYENLFLKGRMKRKDLSSNHYLLGRNGEMVSEKAHEQS